LISHALISKVVCTARGARKRMIVSSQRRWRHWQQPA